MTNAELKAELRFYKKMVDHLINSDEIGFKTIDEAVQILGVPKRTILNHTKCFGRGTQLVPVPWINWYRERQENGWSRKKKPDLEYKKKEDAP